MKTIEGFPWLKAISATLFLIAAGLPGTSAADIYKWVDAEGTIHFTDSLSNIPANERSRAKKHMEAPPASGQPSLSTIGRPSPGPGRPSASPFPAPVPSAQKRPTAPEEPDHSAEAEELRARIAAKQQFIDGIDRKRSNILNPLGNRFVSPEDLELYRKYSEDLPKDRDRLKELEDSR